MTKITGRAKGVSGKALKAEIQRLLDDIAYQVNQAKNPDPEWDDERSQGYSQGLRSAWQAAADNLAKAAGLKIEWVR